MLNINIEIINGIKHYSFVSRGTAYTVSRDGSEFKVLSSRLSLKDSQTIKLMTESAMLKRAKVFIEVLAYIEVVEAAAVEPVAVEPVAVEPVAVEPVAVEPVAVEPVAVEPVAVEPVAVEPVAVEPVAVEPVAVEAVNMHHHYKNWQHHKKNLLCVRLI